MKQNHFPLRLSRRFMAALSGVLALFMIAGFGAGPAEAVIAQEKDPLKQKVAASENFSPETHVLRSGHVDLGPRILDGKWQLAARDDSGETPLWTHPENTVFAVNDKAMLNAPESGDYNFTGAAPGSPVHVIPQTQIPGVPWLGWNTQSPEVVNAVAGGVTLRFRAAQGPGKVTIYLESGNLSKPTVLFDSQRQQAQDVWVETNTHTHANWVFTQPGVYLVALDAEAKTQAGQTLRSAHLLRFAIGDGTSPESALATQWQGMAPATGEESSVAAEASAPDAPAASAAPDPAAPNRNDPKKPTAAESAGWGWGPWVALAGGAVLIFALISRGIQAKKQREAVAARRLEQVKQAGEDV